ncbi:hypothetical protein PENTCL1PPCAC_4597, partial [Pristionchus entomophagus]
LLLLLIFVDRSIQMAVHIMRSRVDKRLSILHLQWFYLLLLCFILYNSSFLLLHSPTIPHSPTELGSLHFLLLFLPSTSPSSQSKLRCCPLSKYIVLPPEIIIYSL